MHNVLWHLDVYKRQPLEYHTDRLAELKNVSISYDGRKVCEGVNFEVRRGERICLRGRNGCGKSSILKMILGEKIPYTGEMQVGTGIKISYVPQDASFLQGSLEDMALEYDLEESLFKACLLYTSYYRRDRHYGGDSRIFSRTVR